LDPGDLEAKLTLANLRLCQSKFDEVRDLINELISPWYKETNNEDEQDEESDIVEEEEEEIKGDKIEEQEKHVQRIFSIDDINLPTYSQRISIVKLCIEVQLYEEALDFLQTLLADDDEDVDNWYLCGWTYYLMQDMVAAQEYLTKALEVNISLIYFHWYHHKEIFFFSLFFIAGQAI
jgi:tetratricopeptide (TPR) repeat protein